MSITAGYHRLWSHKTYDANIVVRVILAIGGAMALQNSILHWSSDHRIHHRHVDDNDKDPYSAKRGLWFAHIGWMLREYQEKRYDDYRNCKDLQKDKVVMWQHNYYNSAYNCALIYRFIAHQASRMDRSSAYVCKL